MNEEKILEAVSFISDETIMRAELLCDTKSARTKPLYRVALLAACLFIACALAISLPRILETQRGIITGWNTNQSACYVSPLPGTWFYYIDVQEAMNEHSNENTQYLLAFDIFSGNNAELTVSELSDEYTRLEGLGYQLYEVQYWDYYGDGQKATHTTVAGLFTEAELSAFKASNNYGYAFHFVYNGDSSPVSFDKASAVTYYTRPDGIRISA